MSSVVGARVSHGEVRGASRRDDVAGRLALAGAALGILAGLVELLVGPSVREWVGDKQDTTRLGLTTILLSAIALAAAAALRKPTSELAGRRVAVALGLLVPALVCFSTVGRLWYAPGALLLVSGGLVVAGTSGREVAATFDERRWRIGLLAACGVYYVFLGATALGAAGVLGVIGGVLLWLVPRAARRSQRAAHIFLLGGALPFAVVTWWSVVTPFVAIVAIAVGHVVIRHERPVRA